MLSLRGPDFEMNESHWTPDPAKTERGTDWEEYHFPRDNNSRDAGPKWIPESFGANAVIPDQTESPDLDGDGEASEVCVSEPQVPVAAEGNYPTLGVIDSTVTCEKKPKLPPMCGNCRNHNVWTVKKGHKKDCKFRDCPCQKCGLNKERQRVMARHAQLKKEVDSGKKIGGKRLHLEDQQILTETSSRSPTLPVKKPTSIQLPRAVQNLPTDMPRLEDSLFKLLASFEQHTPSLTAMYVALLKECSYDHESAMRKIQEGEADALYITGKVKMRTQVPPSPPISYPSNYGTSPFSTPSPSSSLVPSAFHSALSYPPFIPGYHGYSLSSHQNSPALGHLRMEPSSPLISSMYYYPYSTAGSGFMSSTITSDVRVTSPLRPGETSADTSGSPEYNVKEDSDKESTVDAHLPNSLATPIEELRESREHRLYPERYNLRGGFQDMRETAANA